MKVKKYINLIKTSLLGLWQLSFLLLLQNYAHAACPATGVNPAAEIGTLNFDTSVLQFKYCDGTNWQGLGGSFNYPLTAPNGAVEAPSYSFSTSTSSGVFTKPSGELGLSVWSKDRLIIDPTGFTTFNYFTSYSSGTAASSGIVRLAGDGLGLGYYSDNSCGVSCTSTFGGGLRFYGSNGNFVQLSGPASMTTSYGINLPSGLGAAGQFVKFNTSGNWSWSSIPPRFPVSNVTTSNFSAPSGTSFTSITYVVSSASHVTFNLPFSSARGSVLTIKKMGLGNVLVAPMTGGESIDGVYSIYNPIQITEFGASISILKDGSNGSWIILDGGPRVSTGSACKSGLLRFISPGIYNVNVTTAQVNAKCSFQITVRGAGGGSALYTSGGYSLSGVGGVGGGVQFNFTPTVSGTFAILVGQRGTTNGSGHIKAFGGGGGMAYSSFTINDTFAGGGGGASAIRFNSTVLAIAGGGGGGGLDNPGTASYTGGNGGSGGGNGSDGTSGNFATMGLGGGANSGGSGGAGATAGGAGGSSSGNGGSSSGTVFAPGGDAYAGFGVSGGGGAISGASGYLSASGGGGYGGGGGASYASGNLGSGGGGGGYVDFANVLNPIAISGGGANQNGSIFISWQ